MENKEINKEYTTEGVKALEPEVLVEVCNIPANLQGAYIDAIKRGNQELRNDLIANYLNDKEREKKHNKQPDTESKSDISNVKESSFNLISEKDYKEAITKKDTHKIEEYKEPGKVIKESGIPYLRHLIEASPGSTPCRQLWVDSSILRACYYFEGLDCNYFIISYRPFNLTDFKVLICICQQADRKKSPTIETSIREICNTIDYPIGGGSYKKITDSLHNLFSTEIVSINKWDYQANKRYSSEDFYKAFHETGLPPAGAFTHILSFEFKDSQGITIYLDNVFYKDLERYKVYLEPRVYQLKSIQELNFYSFSLTQYGKPRSIELKSFLSYLNIKDTNICRAEKKIRGYPKKFRKLGLKRYKKLRFYKKNDGTEMVTFINK